MLTEQTHTEPNWKLLPGTILDGGYEMEELLEADERRARFKIRVLGDRTIDAFASFFPVNGPAAQEQVETWELLRRVPHVNLSKPLAAGKRELEGTAVAYVVLRKPDETLNGVLGERALTAEEATEVLLSGARALEHLGRHGLVHGSVSPVEVLAVGDAIQLSAEGVRKAESANGSWQLKAKYVAPESTSGNATTAAAVWCLGATVFETLTQNTCGDGCREEAKRLPLGWVLERCLDPEPNKRSRPEEIPVLLKNGPPAVVEAAPTVAASVSSAANAPGEEVKPEVKTEVRTASAAAGTTSPASTAAAGMAAPASVPRKPIIPDAPSTKPTASSLSQARVKALQQSEFDALTTPQRTAGGSAVKASASAALGGASASAGFGASQATGGARPTASTGMNLNSARAGASPAGSALLGTGGAEVRSRPGRTSFDLESEPQQSRLWMYIAAGVVVVLLLFWALRSKPAKTSSVASAGSSSPAQTATPATNSSTTSSTAAPNKAWPTRTLEPEKAGAVGSAAKVNEPARPAVATKVEAGAASGAIWRVVVYTFNRQDDAEKKVRTLNAKHPHLEAQVFSPSGHSGPYLVTVGGRMTKEDAARFRSRALASGLPHDSYIQNYKP